MISSEDIEVIIGSDEDEPELSETEELSLANRFSAFKGKKFDFSLKLVNPDKMSEFQTVQIGKAGVISSVTSLKAFISQKVSQLPNISVNIESVEYGYIGPGHGARGKKVWIYNDDDVAAMYETHSGNRTIRLWCYTHACTRKICTGKSKASSGSKFEQHSEKLSDVDEICAKLSEKHKGEYSKDQLRAWAHMINMGKYESYDEAPDKPFWKGRKRQRSDDQVPSNSSSKRPASFVASPSKKVGIRSELITQLKQWHALLESGVVSQSEYDEMKSAIMTDMKDLQK